MNPKALALTLAGLLLISANLFYISPMVMESTETALSEATIMTNETWEDPDWLASKDERSYYAWNLMNADAMAAGVTEEMELEKVGPVTYEITSKREVLYHDEDAGTLTYSEVNSFEWVGGESGDTQLTNINILWNPQRIGATSLAVDIGTLFAKGYFTRNMLEFDLTHRAPAELIAEQIEDDVDDFSEELGTPYYGESMFFTNLYHDWNNTAEAQQVYLTTLEGNNTTEGVSWSRADFTADSNTLLYSVTEPGDELVCIAMTCSVGLILIAEGPEPDYTASKMVVDPDNSASLARATYFGYVATDESGQLDPLATWVADQSLYHGVQSRWSAARGGIPIGQLSYDELNDRLEQMTGLNIDHNETIERLLFGVEEDGTYIGLLVCDNLGITCGATAFLQGALDDPFGTMNRYTVDSAHRFGYTELVAIGQNWAGGWFLGDSEFETVLTGGEGRLNADDWLLESFGSKDPVTGGYIALGLNLAGVWPMMYGSAVDVDPSVSENILFGETHGLTTSFGVDFLFGEMSGLSVPMNETYVPTAGGTQHVWNDSFVAELYDVDENTAKSLRWLIREKVFNELIGDLLTTFYDASPYLTQSVNEWLLGWRDPLVATLEGDGDDPDLGWVSLEKNETYYGSDGVSTESSSIITVYTGAGAKGLPGQRIAEDGDIHLPWRSPARNESAYGMLDPIVQSGVVGTVFPADEPATMNLGGYAVATSEIVGEGSIQGIETVHHRIILDPRENPIQAKLIGAEGVLDVFPGALPIYFGGQVDLQVEPNVNAVIGVEMDSYFYLDIRGVGATDPDMGNLTPVFQIQVVQGIEPDQAEVFKDKVVHNVRPYAYWTNMDTGGDAMYIDQITLAIWIVADLLLLAGITMVVLPKLQEDDEEDDVNAAFDGTDGVEADSVDDDEDAESESESEEDSEDESED